MAIIIIIYNIINIIIFIIYIEALEAERHLCPRLPQAFTCTGEPATLDSRWSAVAM